MKKRPKSNRKMSNNYPANFEQPGSLPLKSQRAEKYARERCLGSSPTQALIAAGFSKSIARTKPGYLEDKKAVRARIRYLNNDDVELLREKRAKLESFLWLALEVDRSEFYEVVDVPLRAKNGDVVIDPSSGKPLTKQVEQLKSFENLTDYQRQLIEGISYTERGKPNLRLVSKQFAYQELAKLLLSVAGGITKEFESELAMGSVEQALQTLRQKAHKFGLTDFLANNIDVPITVTERSIRFEPREDGHPPPSARSALRLWHWKLDYTHRDAGYPRCVTYDQERHRIVLHITPHRLVPILPSITANLSSSREATMMVVILQLTRLALIGVGFYMLYLTLRKFPTHPDWLMLSALLLNLAYLFAVPRLSRLMKVWFDAEEQELKSRKPWPLLQVTNTAPGITGTDVVTSEGDSGHRLALRVKLRAVAPTIIARLDRSLSRMGEVSFEAFKAFTVAYALLRQNRTA